MGQPWGRLVGLRVDRLREGRLDRPRTGRLGKLRAVPQIMKH